MKTKLLAIAVFATTAAAVGFYPAWHASGAATATPVLPVQVAPGERPHIDVVFVLDTTGSMGGLIQAAKEKIWSIASTMASAQPAPEIRVGLVAFRDRGDTYVTRVVDLSSDLDSMYAKLMDLSADGGGDGPESVNQALDDAVNKVSWTQSAGAYKVVFLVGDSPPHMDYQDDVKYPVTVAAAKARGIVINTIQCGNASGTTREWQQIAQLGAGSYFRVNQSGGAVAVATPFDDKLARLAEELDGTRLFYGDATAMHEAERKMKATAKLNEAASLPAKARRATFNASASGAGNLAGEHDLVEDVLGGRVELDKVATEQLPESMRDLDSAGRQAMVAKTAQRRDQLKKEIRALAEERAGFIDQKVKEAGGARESLDAQLYDTVREQAGALGLAYPAAAPAY